MSELKPCPFCGGRARRIDFENSDDPNFGGSCIECLFCQAASAVEFNYKETLVERWNRRTALDDLRTPTWEMQIAGRDAMLAEDDSLDLTTDDARACWEAMIDAAREGGAA